MSSPVHPGFIFFPALPLERMVELADWRIGPLDPAVPWRSVRFRDLCRALLDSYTKLGFRNGAVMWHAQRGFDGEYPTTRDALAIQRAINFAALDANDRIARDENAGHYLATLENGSMFTQPIDEAKEYVTHREGGLLRNGLVFGRRIGGKPPQLPGATVPIDGHVPVSGKLVRAVFDRVRDQRPRDEQIVTALDWLFLAMSNPRAVNLGVRIVALKTAFEALLQEDKSRICARNLRTLFAGACKRHHHLFPWKGTLWSPSEAPVILRRWKRNQKWTVDRRTPLEDWFMYLAEARNRIIHDGELSMTEYAPPRKHRRSPYRGHLFWTGERILREAIKARLGPHILLCGRIREWQRFKEMATELNAMRAHTGEAEAEPELPPTDANAEAPSRDTSELLRLLDTTEAADILLSKAVAIPSADNEIASRNAHSAAQWWVAENPDSEISIRVTRGEKEALLVAGAQIATSDYVEPCE